MIFLLRRKPALQDASVRGEYEFLTLYIEMRENEETRRRSIGLFFSLVLAFRSRNSAEHSRDCCARAQQNSSSIGQRNLSRVFGNNMCKAHFDFVLCRRRRENSLLCLSGYITT